MNETLERLSDEITNRNVSVTQTDLPTIDADPAQISLLFQEILQNSLKFSDKASPSITIKTAPSKNAEHVRIIIQDNGIGFESQYASQMFEVFMRLNNPGDYPGTGVGLTLCQAICTRHGGNIQAMATPDGGAQIIVSLPMQQNASAPSAQVAS